jgi:lipoprotein-releasing system ATP-binding protein
MVPPAPTFASASAPVALSARGLTKRYKIGAETLDVLRGVDLDVREGEILAILGTSGSGKSTLLHVLGWLDHADAGTIHYEGRDRASLSASERANLRNRVMGFVFQFYHLLPELTAVENVMLPSMILHGPRAWREQKHEARARAERMLDRVGLGKRRAHRPSQLSGGERQRVAIARALQNQPRFLLCDEPTGNLDGRTAADIRRLLWDLNASDHQTLVVVTHDVRLAHDAHRAVHLMDGRVVAGGGLEDVEPPPSLEDVKAPELLHPGVDPAGTQGVPGFAQASPYDDPSRSSEDRPA